MSLRLLAVTAAVLLSVPAYAQQSVKLEFNGGRVSVSVQNAQVRAVLAEWARLSGTTIVNGDRLAGPPVTLELNNVTERQALDTLLRNVAGYVLAPRRAGTTGVSAFDRIMILPTSVGPVNPAGAPAAAGVRPIAVPRPLVFGVPQPDDTQSDNAPDDDAPPQTPTVRVGQPVVGVPRPLIPAPAPNQQPERSSDDQDGAPADQQTEPAGASRPGNPFGIPAGSSTTPGFVTPAPPAQPAPNTPQGR